MSAKILSSISGLLLCAVLISFAPSRPGGEGFEIFINNNPVMVKFGKDMDKVQTLKLDAYKPNDAVTIRYHHCGKVGKNRTLTLRDAKNNILKQWKFDDVKQASASMSFKVKEILALQKDGSMSARLYYSSSELPGGRQLAALVSSKSPTS